MLGYTLPEAPFPLGLSTLPAVAIRVGPRAPGQTIEGCLSLGLPNLVSGP
jgi:hypothetical protein